jgi:hypothetical protein
MKISTSTKIGLGIGLIRAIATSILFVFAILRSTLSTAAIGFVFIPVYVVISFIGFYIWDYSLGYIKIWSASATRTFNFKIAVAFLIGICVAVFLVVGLGKKFSYLLLCQKSEE